MFRQPPSGSFLRRAGCRDGLFSFYAEKRNAAEVIAIDNSLSSGAVEVLINNQNGPPTLLRQTARPANHWITLTLAGTRSNGSALGAKVRVTAGALVQTDEVRSGGSYLSQNDVRVHFGLGKATKIDSLEIRWPSGKVETIKDLEADKFYSILEGQGIVPAEKIRPAERAAQPKQ